MEDAEGGLVISPYHQPFPIATELGLPDARIDVKQESRGSAPIDGAQVDLVRLRGGRKSIGGRERKAAPIRSP